MKKKTFKQCCDEVAKKMYLKGITYDDAEIDFFKEAAELYNQKKMDEINKLREQRDRLKELLEKFLTYQDNDNLMWGDLDKEAKELIAKAK